MQAVNALTISCKPYLFYAFTPFSIIPLVLLTQIPVVLPNKENTLYMPSKPELIHPLYPKLTLLMCHISGDPMKIEGFQKELSIILSSWRKSMQRQYVPYLSKWSQYRCSRKLDSLSTTVEEGVNFLAELL